MIITTMNRFSCRRRLCALLWATLRSYSRRPFCCRFSFTSLTASDFTISALLPAILILSMIIQKNLTRHGIDNKNCQQKQTYDTYHQQNRFEINTKILYLRSALICRNIMERICCFRIFLINHICAANLFACIRIRNLRNCIRIFIRRCNRRFCI